MRHTSSSDQPAASLRSRTPMNTNTLSDIAKQLGKRGGNQTRKRGRDYYRAIGRKGALKRWKNHKKLDSSVNPV